MYDVAREIIWLRSLMAELGYTELGPTLLQGDNQGCLSIASNFRTDSRTKHVDIKYDWQREQIKNGSITLKYCPTELMIADSLTKPVSTGKFIWCRNAMGIGLTGPV